MSRTNELMLGTMSGFSEIRIKCGSKRTVQKRGVYSILDLLKKKKKCSDYNIL